MRISTLLRIASLGLLLLGGCQTVKEAVGNATSAFDTKLGGNDTAATGSSGDTTGARNSAVQLPRCTEPLGSIALVEGRTEPLAQYGLTSPVPLTKLMAQQSRCFRVVNRGAAFDVLQKEQSLHGGKASRLVPADFLLTVNIISKNQNAGGVGGGVGAFLPTYLGLIAGGLRTNNVEASIQLVLTRVSDGVELVITTGSASKSDLSWFGLGGGFGIPAVGGLGGWTNTEVGKIVAAALLDGFAKLVPLAQKEVSFAARS